MTPSIQSLFKRIAAGEGTHLCIAYLLTLAASLVSSSAMFDRWLGIPHLDILNYSASPMEWLLLVLVISAYLKPPRAVPPVILQERIRWFEYVSLLLFIASVVLALRITHPNDEMFVRMTRFITDNPTNGGPLVAAMVAIFTVLPFFPAYAFIAPVTVLEKGWELFVLFVTLVVCFLIGVIEAMYFAVIAPILMMILTKALLIFSWNVYANMQYHVLSIEGFRVVIGPACAGLGTMLLFLFLFAYLVFYFGTTRKISSVRAYAALILGLLSVFALNILRILTLMFVGIRYPDFALTLFHSFIGSVYFFLFFLLCFPLLRRFIIRR